MLIIIVLLINVDVLICIYKSVRIDFGFYYINFDLNRIDFY